MVYPPTKKELYCGTTLKHLCSFYRNIVIPVGLEPTSVVLEATAQPLYHGTIISYYNFNIVTKTKKIKYWYN